MNALLQDQFWLDAARHLAQIMNGRRDVMAIAPNDFLLLGENVVPIEYSHAFMSMGARHFVFCIPKDLWWKLSPAFWPALQESRLVFANDVFVVGGVGGCLDHLDSIEDRHFATLLSSREARPERHQSTLHRADLFVDGNHIKSWSLPGGNSSSVDAIKSEATSLCAGTPLEMKLIVGAAGVGNIGDDLILAAIEQGIGRRDGALLCFGAGGDIHPNVVRLFDAVIVGGGGILYAGNVERPQLDNLANYCKFPYICEALSKPCHLSFAGVQGNVSKTLADCQMSWRFLVGALRRCASISVRDRFSLEEVRRLDSALAARTSLAADPAFLLRQQFVRDLPASQTGSQPIALLLSGELRVFSKIVTNARLMRRLLHAFKIERVDYLVMSEDDHFHAELVGRLVRQIGLKCDIIVPERDASPIDTLLATIRPDRYSLHITTRFHGTIASICTGVPFVSYDHRGGKKCRLMDDFLPLLGRQVVLVEEIHSPRNEFAMISAAIRSAFAGGHSLPELGVVLQEVERALEALR